jgi:hypothetical protein
MCVFTTNFELIIFFKSVQILLHFVFCFENLLQFQNIPKHVNIFKFSFLHSKLQLFFKQHIIFLKVSNNTLLLQKKLRILL